MDDPSTMNLPAREHLIETPHPTLGFHSISAPLLGLSIARAFTSHEPIEVGQMDAEMIKGRVSRYDEKTHVWCEMLQAEHKDYELDTRTQTRAAAAEVIKAREEWSSNWTTHYATQVNQGSLTSAFVFGKHAPMPDDENSPLAILNRYAG